MEAKFTKGNKIVEKRTIKCPHCKKTFEAEVATKVVDDLAYSEARGIEENAKYFKFKCPHCGQTHILEHEMLYVSSKHGQEWAIQLVPSKDDALEKAYEYDELRKNKDKSADYILYRVRLVWELKKFCEKLMIASNMFDDRPLEILKSWVAAELKKAKAPKVKEQMFYTPDRHKFFIMNEFDEDHGYEFEIMRGNYESALKVLKGHPIMETDNDYIVDQEMVENFQQLPKGKYVPVHLLYEAEE